MATIIDATYFVREVLVPGVETPLMSGPLCKFIAEYEPYMLRKAMGYAFYKEFMTAIAEVSPATKWVEIVTGGDFTHCGELKRWNGLKQETIKESCIANYVYYFYMRNEVSQSAVMGEVKSKGENSTSFTPAYKVKDAWNKMVEEIQILWQFLRYKTDDAGALVYDTFFFNAVDCKHFRHINTMGI